MHVLACGCHAGATRGVGLVLCWPSGIEDECHPAITPRLIRHRTTAFTCLLDRTPFSAPLPSPVRLRAVLPPQNAYAQYETNSSTSSRTLRYLTVEVLLSADWDIDSDEGESCCQPCRARYGWRVHGHGERGHKVAPVAGQVSPRGKVPRQKRMQH